MTLFKEDVKRKIDYQKDFHFEKEEKGEYSYAEIEVTLYKEREGLVLTICGKLTTYDGHRSGGQCIDEIYDHFKNNSKIRRIHEVWSRWHLNNLHAGCVHQREFEKEPYENHRNAHCDICDYTYGHSWLFEAIPKEVIEEIKSW